jgi:hypothetical protein
MLIQIYIDNIYVIDNITITFRVPKGIGYGNPTFISRLYFHPWLTTDQVKLKCTEIVIGTTSIKIKEY